MRPFVTAKTDGMYYHIEPTQRNFQSHVKHVGTNDLPTDITQEELPKIIITLSKHSKSDEKENVVSSFSMVTLTKKKQKK